MRNCPFPRYQTQTSSRDKVPGRVFLIASAFSRDARLSGHFLSFSSWTVYVREERDLSDSRMCETTPFARLCISARVARTGLRRVASCRARFQSPSKETATRKRSVSPNDVVELLSTNVSRRAAMNW